jgi:ubiquinone/menaquinone biosynthesis C-methylase UbiE
MSVYGQQVLPRIMNVVCGSKSSHELRERVCQGLSGEVVEIGFGSGHNVAHYPASVTSVAAVEPSDVAWSLARARVASGRVSVVRSGLDGQALPFDDDSFDSELSTWTLCTIPDIGSALAEIRRVLRPGGSLHFLEHGLAPDPAVQRWQHRMEPIHKRLVGGCHHTRRVAEAIEAAGFVITELDVFYEDGAPKVLGADSLGVANVEPTPPRQERPGSG